MGLVKTELGNRTLGIYLASVVGVGFAFGYLTNYLAALRGMDFLAQAQHVHSMVDPTITYGTQCSIGGVDGLWVDWANINPTNKVNAQ